MSLMIEIKRKEKLGQIFTPSLTAKLMAKLLLTKRRKKILDPAVGSGNLLKAVMNEDYKGEYLGLDIDGEWISYLKEQGIEAIQKDFFDYTDTVDAIIMNPPYIRQELLALSDASNKSKQEISFLLGNPKISQKANLYVYFIYKALSTLTQNGTLVVIMPNTWLTSSYGEDLQRTILESFQVSTIVHFFYNVFEDYDVDVSIFCIHKNKPTDNDEVTIFDVNRALTSNNIDEILSKEVHSENLKIFKQLQREIEVFKWFKYRETVDFVDSNLIKLKNVFEITRGPTTNSNDFFIFDEGDELVQLYPEYFKPIVNKKVDINGFVVNQSSINKYVFSTSLSKYELPEEIINYINKYEAKIIKDKSPKTLLSKMSSKPNSWHVLDVQGKEGYIFNYIIRDDMDFILNNQAYLSKDNFYDLVLKNFSEENQKIYLAILNSSFTKYFIEINGRSYGTGLLKIQKYEIDEIPILDINNLEKQDMLEIINLGNQLIDKSDKSNIKQIDSVLKKYYLSDDDTLEDFYRQYEIVIINRKGE